MAFVILILYVGILVAMVAGFWKMFQKAGQPGWASIVPIYNIYVLVQIAGKPTSWFIGCLIPIVNIYFGIKLALAVADKFGKSQAFGFGLAFLSPVFGPMLGFGDAQYRA